MGIGQRTAIIDEEMCQNLEDLA
ncbi:unnamed protein product, partial [Allacma fusca]